MSNKAAMFRALHVKGDPLVLFNIWDAGSARIVAEAGAKALATGSWSVAAAQGFEDGEALPLELALANLRRIVAATELPVVLPLRDPPVVGHAPRLFGRIADSGKARVVGYPCRVFSAR